MTELVLGWLKLTLAFCPRLKVFQLMTALALLWLMFKMACVAVFTWEIEAAPRTTLPPVGNWVDAGGACWAKVIPAIRLRATEAMTPATTEPLELPFFRADLAVSATGSITCLAVFQTKR